MVYLKEITDYIESTFPTSFAEDFDNIGLLAGRTEKTVSKVLLCLDFSKKVCEEAVRKGAELIITHHPVIFSPLKSINDSSQASEAILYAIENGISVYSAHTNLDSANGGLTDYIAQKLSLTPIGTMEGNLGRICTVKEGTTAKKLIKTIKKELNIEKLYSTLTEDKPVKTVALCNGGGGGELVKISQELGADIYISGDLKHHEILELSRSLTDYIEVRHHDCEICVTELLKETLDKKFSGKIETEISACDVPSLIDTDLIV